MHTVKVRLFCWWCVCCIVLLTLWIIILRACRDHNKIAPCGMIEVFLNWIKSFCFYITGAGGGAVCWFLLKLLVHLTFLVLFLLLWWWCRGTNCDQCLSMVQCCFTSAETVRLIRMESPGRPPQLSHSSWTLSCFACKLKHYRGRAKDCQCGWNKTFSVNKWSM